ncbi:MAG: type IV pili methyl-accepting chemotaxis transducer N-terminal domain-containing protein [Candidatus Thiodiazotropha sp. (ex Dulcina madagascariensis)]|nr:type IV pili methyl-accepting chemotaxis transducer N-terminal domain-containing protein [Candidatus Thiodiazotropha sp. (ex Dulcina madagascariensis)]MCU7926107.1 type IV pili methyl-accepting chemotaxis transducer N-terminal domain-containing protein [Candidatus Thiodiazotropha sp. (ex Dulcina madagascariensis)]
MRKLNIPLSLLMLLLIVTGDVLAVTASEYAIVINLSGRQRMLTQKMSKEMLLIANDVDAAGNRANLENTAKLFDTTLKGLRDGNEEMGLPATESKVLLKQLAKIEGLWNEFHGLVSQVVSGGAVDITKVAELNLPLLKNMNTAVRLYEKEAKKATGKSAGIVINLAGKQRMLTQKMSKEMSLVALNHQADDNKSNLRSTASLFDRTLKGLLDGDADLELPGTKDEAIRTQLGVVSKLWKDFKPLMERASGIDAKGVSKDDLVRMSKLNLPLLKEMNKAVKMYEQLEQ